MDSSEESLRQALLIERLANVARDQGVRKGAERDIARRVVEDHKAETLTGGVVRLGSGASVHDVFEAMRASMPEYWSAAPVVAPLVTPAPATTAGRRKRASDRLANANGDTGPRLNGAAE